MSSPVILILLGIFVVLAVVEVMLSARWRPGYLLTGLPVYRKQFFLPRPMPADPLAAKLNQVFGGDKRGAWIFKALAPDVIAFQENPYTASPSFFRLSRVMHAHIRLHGADKLFTITGYLNWSLLVIVLVVLAMLLWPLFSGEGFGVMPLILLVVLAISALVPYFQQVKVHDEIGKVVEGWKG